MKIIDCYDTLLNGKFRKPFILLLLAIACFAVGDFTNKFIKEYKSYFTNGKYSLPYDLLPYYNAGYILHKGEGTQLYNYTKQKESFLELHQKYVKGFSEPGTGYFYNPPNSLFFVYLYSLLSPKICWLLIKSSLLTILLLAVYTAFKELKHKDVWLASLVFILGILYFPPFFINMRNGQFSLLVACCFYFYWYFAQKQKNIFAGFCLALTFIKPQIGIPLLLIPLFFRQYKILFYSFIFTFGLLAFAFVFIGKQGFSTYFLSAFELAGILNTHNVPIPGGPECLTGQLEALKVHINTSKIWGAVLSLFSFVAMIFILLKKKVELSDSYKVFLAGLFSLFIGSYHTDNDYCLIISLVLILIQSNYKSYKQAIAYFTLLSFFAGYLLDRFNIHLFNEVIKLREHSYFKTYFLFSFFVALFLLVKLLIRHIKPKDGKNDLLNPAQDNIQS